MLLKEEIATGIEYRAYSNAMVKKHHQWIRHVQQGMRIHLNRKKKSNCMYNSSHIHKCIYLHMYFNVYIYVCITWKGDCGMESKKQWRIHEECISLLKYTLTCLM